MDDRFEEAFRSVRQLTGVISSIDDAREKLWWNLDVFEWSLSGPKRDPQRSGFAVLDYAKAAASMMAWCIEHEALRLGGMTEYRRREYADAFMKEVRWQPILHDIANSTKHARHAVKYAPEALHHLVLHAKGGDAAVNEEIRRMDRNGGFVHILGLIAQGDWWWESAFSLPGEPSVLASNALAENYADWHRAVEELHDLH